MEMQQIRYFLAVAQSLNFTRAAEACNITQPALTRAIKALEQELGGDLLRREGRLSHLTELGQRMLPILQQCYDSAMSAKALAKSVGQGELAPLSIGVSRTVDSALLMQPLSQLFENMPGLHLTLRRGTESDILEWLKAGEVDLALGSHVTECWERLEAWPMFSESLDLVVGADHPLATRNDLALNQEELREAHILLLGAGARRELDQAPYDKAGINLDTAHVIDCPRDLEQLLAANIGIAILPASMLRDPTLRHLPLDWLGLRRTVVLFTVVGRARSREAQALLSLVRARDWAQAA